MVYATHKSVQVPAEYFVKSAQRDYNSPASAIVRELLQNSRDAGASKIEFLLQNSVSPSGERQVVLTCRDNGLGMDQDVIENKLMALGESTKGLGSSTGGFGVAKILLFFCHPRYEIRTRDLLVAGSGGTYEVQTGLSTHVGVEVRIWLSPAVVGGYSAESYARLIRREISQSHLRQIQVLVSFEEVSAERKAGRRVLDLHGGKIVIHRRLAGSTDDSTSVSVRVKGLHMFTLWTGQSRYVYTVELTGYSTEILTTNRDGLRGDYRREVESAIQALVGDSSASEKSSVSLYSGQSSRAVSVAGEAVKAIAAITDRLVALHSHSPAASAAFPPRDEVIEDLIKAIPDQKVADAVKKRVDTILEDLEVPEDECTHDETSSREHRLREAIKGRISLSLVHSDLFYNVFVETCGAYRGVPKRWRAENLAPRHHDLLEIWSKVVEGALADAGAKGVSFDTGFILDDGTDGDGEIHLAKYRAVEREGKSHHVFLLNPEKYGSAKTLPLGASRRTELVLWLMDLAAHEVTHYLGHSYHNENFIMAESAVKQKMTKNITLYLALAAGKK